jgi:type IV secretion system protein VirD4
MTMQPNQQNTGDPSGPILAALAFAATIAGVLYAAAQLAALAVHHRTLGHVTFETYLAFLKRLPANARHPRDAWPTGTWSANLTGPIPYWIAVALISALTIALVIVLVRTFGGGNGVVGQDRRERFGAPAWPREATRKDLAPLIVDGPTPGRTIIGKARGKLIATEDRSTVKKVRTRTGDRGGVLVVGPARSGKTVIAIGAILEHDWGPVIASSVKTDLLAATIKRRAQLGRVAIFDPLGVVPPAMRTKAKLIGWSPLETANTAVGAQQVASQLLDAAPIDASVRNNDFWANHAHRLAWVTLYAAAMGGRTMRDVVLWTNQGHANSDDPKRRGITDILNTTGGKSEDSMTIADCELAVSIIEGIWADADETRSGIYASTQTLFAPWEDNRIAANAALDDSITIDWLIADANETDMGRNTLFVCMPEHPKEAARFAVVFGGLISSLTDGAYAKRNATNQPINNLLLVLDEAGNTAASWLPEISTTCASVGITLMTLWQSLAQIEHRYRDQAPTLFTNHLTKIFFGGISDGTSGTTASALTGSHEIQTRSRSIDRSSANGRNSESLAATTASLVPPEMLRQVQPGDALCIHGTLQPIHLRTRRYWSDRKLKARADGTSADPMDRKDVSDGPRLADRLRPYQDTTRQSSHERGTI